MGEADSEVYREVCEEQGGLIRGVVMMKGILCFCVLSIQHMWVLLACVCMFFSSNGRKYNLMYGLDGNAWSFALYH